MRLDHLLSRESCLPTGILAISQNRKSIDAPRSITDRKVCATLSCSSYHFSVVKVILSSGAVNGHLMGL